MIKHEEGVICDFSMFPLDKGDSLSNFVAPSIKIVQESGLKYHFGPMSTAIEGTYAECMKVVDSCYEKMGEKSGRISLSLKIDFRRGRKDSMKSKISSVLDKLK
jgi:uncharacterized protein (TIGR00106 family)